MSKKLDKAIRKLEACADSCGCGGHANPQPMQMQVEMDQPQIDQMPVAPQPAQQPAQEQINRIPKVPAEAPTMEHPQVSQQPAVESQPDPVKEQIKSILDRNGLTNYSLDVIDEIYSVLQSQRPQKLDKIQYVEDYMAQ